MTTTPPTDYQNAFLVQIKSFLREEPKERELTLDDCLPVLTGFYVTMSRDNVRSQCVTISYIVGHLNTESLRYKCKDEATLSREICDFLTTNGIPVELYQIDDNNYSDEEDDAIPTIPMRTVGVTLKLYR